jgi:hypothetical protein
VAQSGFTLEKIVVISIFSVLMSELKKIVVVSACLVMFCDVWWATRQC